MTARAAYNVLFLCTGNSARSILAEAILNRLGDGRFQAHSAGSNPTGCVNPYALRLLRAFGYATETLRSKSWSEFSGPAAPAMDIVFTVCDHTGQEACPVWSGHPMMVHWGVPDPASVEGTDIAKRQAFEDTYRLFHERLGRLVSLPMATFDRTALRRELDKIGHDLPQTA